MGSPELPQPPRPSEGLRSQEGLRPRVLLAEDTQGMRDMLVMVLKMKGCDVDVVTNGELFVAKLKEMGPGYYTFGVSDNSMPGGNGIDAVEKIRKEMQDFSDLEIIIFSGDEGENAVKLNERARKLGR